MAFCTACGAQVADGEQFCTKCGKPLPVASAGRSVPASTTAAPAPAARQGGDNALKILLIVLAVVVGLGVIFAGLGFYAVRHVARHAKVTVKDSGAAITTPFGSVETSKDATALAEKAGIEIYPGAKAEEEGSTVSAGGKNIVALNFVTDDPPAKVAEFYKSKYPGALISEDHDQHTITSGGKNDLLTIAIEPHGARTAIHISRITNR